MDLTCIDTVEVILSDWCDTGAGTTESLQKKNLSLSWSSCESMIMTRMCEGSAQSIGYSYRISFISAD